MNERKTGPITRFLDVPHRNRDSPASRPRGERLAVRRIAAYLLDCLPLFLVLAPAGYLVQQALGIAPQTGREIWFTLLLNFSAPVWLYFILGDTSRRGATLGKRVMGIRVLQTGGKRVGPTRAVGRTAVKLLPWELTHFAAFALSARPGELSALQAAGIAVAIVLAVGYFAVALYTGGRQSVHDLLVKTRVASANPEESMRGKRMRFTLWSVFLIMLIAVLAEGAAAQQALPADSTILRLIRERVEARQSGGMVVGVLEADGSTRYIAYGEAGAGAPSLDEQSVFEIGSITKVFTATLLAEMAARGEVALDGPVRKHLPEGTTVPSWNGREITLAELATHTSGLPRLPTNLLPADLTNPYAAYDEQRLYDFLAGYRLPREPGARYEYSNLGMGLLGHALALRAGKTFEELITERILRPLGMHRTGITLTPELQRRLARGHNALGAVVPYWDFPILAGAGALRSTAADLLRFAAANLEPPQGRLEEAMARTHAPRAQAGPGTVQVGLGWHLIRPVKREILWHNGGTGGFRSFLGLDRERGVAVVVLSNTVFGDDDLGFHLLDERAPLQPVRAAASDASFRRATRYYILRDGSTTTVVAGVSRQPVGAD